VTLWLVVLPLVLIGAAGIASFVFVRMSSLHITSETVEIRNYPQATTAIPLDRVDRFVPADRVGMFAFLRPPTAVLLLTDGSRLPARAMAEPEAGYGIEALNRRVAVLRGT
jgi:hypothetical protein